MCDYSCNTDIAKYSNALLDVMIPLTAQFCVVCWLKEQNNWLLYIQKGIMFMKVSSFRNTINMGFCSYTFLFLISSLINRKVKNNWS